MANFLSFKIGVSTFEAEPVKVERRKVYGFTEIAATTSDGRAARQVSVAGNGMTIIPKGGYKLVQTSATGEWVDKADLTARYADGREVVKVESSFSSAIDLNREATEEELLEHVIDAVYQLSATPDFIAEIGNRIMMFPFSYRGGNSYDDAFLLTQGDNLFMLVGKRVDFDMIGLAEQAFVEEDESIDEDDELDFSMF